MCFPLQFNGCVWDFMLIFLWDASASKHISPINDLHYFAWLVELIVCRVIKSFTVKKIYSEFRFIKFFIVYSICENLEASLCMLFDSDRSVLLHCTKPPNFHQLHLCIRSLHFQHDRPDSHNNYWMHSCKLTNRHFAKFLPGILRDHIQPLCSFLGEFRRCGEKFCECEKEWEKWKI